LGGSKATSASNRQPVSIAAINAAWADIEWNSPALGLAPNSAVTARCTRSMSSAMCV